jgi:hypothetical protein
VSAFIGYSELSGNHGGFMGFGGTQLVFSLQLQGTLGVGAFGGGGLGYSGNLVNEAPQSGWYGGLYGEAEIGYGVTAGGSITQNGNQSPTVAVSSPRGGFGGGAYLGGGAAGGYTFATPMVPC